jgi:Type III restriction enzyme, res subunit
MLKSYKNNNKPQPSMLLSPEERQRLIQAATAVYRSYLLLDQLNRSARLCVNGQILTFKNYINALVEKDPASTRIQDDCSIKGENYTILLEKQQENSYSVTIQSNESAERAKTENSFLDLTTTHTISLSRNNPNQLYQLSICIPGYEAVQIGGVGKIMLYPTHIVNLKKMVEALSQPQDPHMLIAMATGSGKSFTQALWFLALKLANIDGVFTVPNESLARQLHRDFRRLLPANVVESLVSNAPPDALQKWMITTHADLLMNKWGHLYPPQKTIWLSFDEIDLIQEELQKRRIVERLRFRYPLLFLGATPSHSIYEKTPTIISLTPQEKLALKLANPTQLESLLAQDTMSKTAQQTRFAMAATTAVLLGVGGLVLFFIIHPVVAFYLHAAVGFPAHWAIQFFLIRSLETGITSIIISLIQWPLQVLSQRCFGNNMRDLITQFIAQVKGLFQGERSSAAHDYIDRSEACFAHHPVSRSPDLMTSVRWNIHSPLGESALILADDPTVLINLDLALRGERNQVYANQRYYARYALYDAYYLGSLFNAKYDQSYEAAHRNLRIENFKEVIQKHYPDYSAETIADLIRQVDFSNTPHYLKYRVMHGLINTALCYLTGLDCITLNQERHNNLETLIQRVKDKLETSPDNLDDFLSSKKLEGALKEEVAEQIRAVIQALRTCCEPQQAQALRTLIDNWTLDKNLHHFMRVGDAYSVLEALVGKTQDAIQAYLQETLKDPRYQLHAQTLFAHLGKPNPTAADYKAALSQIHQILKILPSDSLLLGRLNTFCEQYQSIFRITLQTADAQKEDLIFYHLQAGQHHDIHPDNVNGCPHSLRNINALSEMGLTTLIDAEKISGFSNPNLQHTALLLAAEDTLSEPAKILQAQGRNRGLDATKLPWFFIASETQCFFDLKKAQKGKFYPAFFQATAQYRQQIIKGMGAQIGQQLLAYLAQNMNCLGEIDEIALAQYCQTLVNDHFIQLYNKNEHDLEKTKREFQIILKATIASLHQYETLIKTGEQPTLFYRLTHLVVGNILLKVTFYLYAACYACISWIGNTLIKQNQALQPNELAYLYILRKFSLEAVWKDHCILQQTMEKIAELDQLMQADKKQDVYRSKIFTFIHNLSYQKALRRTLTPLIKEEMHLLAILNALYPKADNREKITKIKNFYYRVVAKQVSGEKSRRIGDEKRSLLAVNEYRKPQSNNEFEPETLCRNSSYEREVVLYDTLAWIQAINQELVNCYACHYEIEALVNTQPPRLQLPGEEIWSRYRLRLKGLQNFSSSGDGNATQLAAFCAYVLLLIFLPDLLPLLLYPLTFIASLTPVATALTGPVGIIGVMLYMVGVFAWVYFPQDAKAFLFGYPLQAQSQSINSQINLLAEKPKLDFIKNTLSGMITTIGKQLTEQTSRLSEEEIDAPTTRCMNNIRRFSISGLG